MGKIIGIVEGKCVTRHALATRQLAAKGDSSKINDYSSELLLLPIKG
ncbi:MAG: hypothetical protein HC808_05285 [Candidatus Competibacteraceae bacterium]|nr:hypothetical protein [Candidatus Competibacteraceae bacterium]